MVFIDTASPFFMFLASFVSGLFFLVVFAWLYREFTPMREITLIRQGNTAAAISFGGSMVGFAIPLGRAIEQSDSMADLFIWSMCGLLVQMLVFTLAHRVMPEIARRIEAGKQSEAILLAFSSVAVGILNAASMTL